MCEQEGLLCPQPFSAQFYADGKVKFTELIKVKGGDIFPAVIFYRICDNSYRSFSEGGNSDSALYDVKNEYVTNFLNSTDTVPGFSARLRDFLTKRRVLYQSRYFKVLSTKWTKTGDALGAVLFGLALLATSVVLRSRRPFLAIAAEIFVFASKIFMNLIRLS